MKHVSLFEAIEVESSLSLGLAVQAILYGLAPAMGTRLYREFVKHKNLVQQAKEYAQSEIDRGVEAEQLTRDIMAVLEKSPEYQKIKVETETNQ